MRICSLNTMTHLSSRIYSRWIPDAGNILSCLHRSLVRFMRICSLNTMTFFTMWTMSSKVNFAAVISIDNKGVHFFVTIGFSIHTSAAFSSLLLSLCICLSIPLETHRIRRHLKGTAIGCGGVGSVVVVCHVGSWGY